MNAPQSTSPRRRLQELLAIPDNQRSDAEWDELNELEISLAPGNREGAPDPNLRRPPPSTRPGVKPTLAAALSAAVLAGALAGAGAAERPTIRIGSKNFTEQLLLGEMYALLLEAAGYKVDRKLNLGGGGGTTEGLTVGAPPR